MKKSLIVAGASSLPVAAMAQDFSPIATDALAGVADWSAPGVVILGAVVLIGVAKRVFFTSGGKGR